MTKTAEEIMPKGEDVPLYQGGIRYGMVDRDEALNALHEYAAPLKKRIEELEAQTTLYGVCNYSWDGGGSNRTLYRTIEEARIELLADVKKAQEESDSCYQDCPEDAPIKWHEISPDLWTNELDNMTITKYALNPSTNGKQD